MSTKKASRSDSDIAETYKLYLDAKKRVEKAKESLSSLETEADILFQSLVASIPAGETRSGLLHKRFERKSVSYASALSSIRETLIPKTKQDAVDAILTEFTKISYTDKIEPLI